MVLCGNSAYGAKMQEKVGTVDLQKIINLLIAACEKTIFNWNIEIAFLEVTAKK